MRERIVISAALAAFIVVFLAPFWFAHRTAKHLANGPDLQMPSNAKECIASAAYMRRSHMQLLVSWREDVVRNGNRQFIAQDGKVYEKSLSRTCLGCHSKQEFCDRCHEYAGVSGAYCWNCHSAPQTAVAFRSEP